MLFDVVYILPMVFFAGLIFLQRFAILMVAQQRVVKSLAPFNRVCNRWTPDNQAMILHTW
jgi:hypothetical protein